MGGGHRGALFVVAGKTQQQQVADPDQVQVETLFAMLRPSFANGEGRRSNNSTLAVGDGDGCHRQEKEGSVKSGWATIRAEAVVGVRQGRCWHAFFGVWGHVSEGVQVIAEKDSKLVDSVPVYAHGLHAFWIAAGSVGRRDDSVVRNRQCLSDGE